MTTMHTYAPYRRQWQLPPITADAELRKLIQEAPWYSWAVTKRSEQTNVLPNRVLGFLYHERRLGCVRCNQGQGSDFALGLSSVEHAQKTLSDKSIDEVLICLFDATGELVDIKDFHQVMQNIGPVPAFMGPKGMMWWLSKDFQPYGSLMGVYTHW